MATLIYAFDEVERYPILETQSTVRAPVAQVKRKPDSTPFLQVCCKRQGGDAVELKLIIALHPIIIDGTPDELLLDVFGDAGGCRISLEAADRLGWGLAYSFGRVVWSGWRTCRADVSQPAEFWGERKRDGTPGMVPPLQPHRLRLTLPTGAARLHLGLGRLSVSGSVRLGPAGIA